MTAQKIIARAKTAMPPPRRSGLLLVCNVSSGCEPDASPGSTGTPPSALEGIGPDASPVCFGLSVLTVIAPLAIRGPRPHGNLLRPQAAPGTHRRGEWMGIFGLHGAAQQKTLAGGSLALQWWKLQDHLLPPDQEGQSARRLGRWPAP